MRLSRRAHGKENGPVSQTTRYELRTCTPKTRGRSKELIGNRGSPRTGTQDSRLARGHLSPSGHWKVCN